MPNRIKVQNEVGVYEIDGEDIMGDCEPLVVKSHWHIAERIVLVIGGKEYTVLAGDLQAAVQNATNAG